MKVKELIEELQKAHPDSPVRIRYQKFSSTKAGSVKFENSSSMVAMVIICEEGCLDVGEDSEE